MPDAGTGQIYGLVVPHLAALFRLAWRLTRNSSDAQDLVQDTCMAACEHPADLAAADHPQRWLLRVLNNRFIDGARRRKRSPLVLVEDTGGAAQVRGNDPSPEELLLQAEAERDLERAFLQLDQMQRTLLALRAEGYDLAEIEAVTGISREVLRARLHRARRSLATHLTEQTGATGRMPRTGSKP